MLAVYSPAEHFAHLCIYVQRNISIALAGGGTLLPLGIRSGNLRRNHGVFGIQRQRDGKFKFAGVTLRLAQTGAVPLGIVADESGLREYVDCRSGAVVAFRVVAADRRKRFLDVAGVVSSDISPFSAADGGLLLVRGGPGTLLSRFGEFVWNHTAAVVFFHPDFLQCPHGAGKLPCDSRIESVNSDRNQYPKYPFAEFAAVRRACSFINSGGSCLFSGGILFL